MLEPWVHCVLDPKCRLLVLFPWPDLYAYLTTSGKQKLALTIMVNGHTPSIRNLRIAMSGLINQLRVIKYIGEEIPKVKVASENDSGLTTVKGDSVLVNPKLNQAKTKAAPQKKKKRKRGKRR